MENQLWNVVKFQSENFNQSAKLETFQALCDLAYLTLSPSDWEAISQNTESDNLLAVIKNAIYVFRCEYEELGLLPYRFSFYNPNDYKEYTTKLNNMELSLLQNILSLDGEFPLKNLPDFGIVNLHTRLIHYRLSLLGLLGDAEKIDDVFQEKTLISLENIRKYLEIEANDLELLNMIGDLMMLEKAWIKDKKEEELVQIDERKRTAKDIFLTRLYQLHLWVRGFYDGKIDGSFQEISKESTKDLIKTMEELPRKKTFRDLFQSKKALFLNTKTADIFSLIKFSLEPINEDEMEDRGLADTVDKDMTEAETQKCFEIILEETKANLKAGRKLYLGVKNLGTKMQAFLRELFNKKETIINNIFRGLFREIREGLVLLNHGFYCLFHRTIETQNADNQLSIYNRFGNEGDTFLLCSDSFTIDEIRMHREKMYYFVNSIQISLAFTGTVLGLILNLGTCNWFQFARTIAREYMKLRDKLRIQTFNNSI